MEYTLYAKVYPIGTGNNSAELSTSLSSILYSHATSGVRDDAAYICYHAVRLIAPEILPGLYKVCFFGSSDGNVIVDDNGCIRHLRFRSYIINIFDIKPGRYKIELKPIDMVSV